MKERFRNVVRVGKEIVDDVGEHDLSGFAAQLAYRFFLALFPFFIFLAALGGVLADVLNAENPTQDVMDLLGDSLPDDASSVLRGELEELTQSSNPGLLSVGIVGALWTAAGGVGALIKGFNRIYEVDETRSIVKRYALALGLTLLACGLLLLAFVLLVVGETYGAEINNELGVSGAARAAIEFGRWPAIPVALLVATSFLYWAAPSVQIPFKLVSAGAVFFSLGWVITTYLFGLYVANFGNYNATYGTLGGVVILLFWTYLTGFLLLLGCEINVFVGRRIAAGELVEKGVQAAGEQHGTSSSGRDDNPQSDEPPQAGKKGLWLGTGLLGGFVVWRALRGLVSRRQEN